MSSILLEILNVSKRFGPTQALSSVSLDVRSGEVLALIGENGAGKSTLLKVLSGAHRADQGELRLQGQPYCPSGNPHQARKAGVAMIYQELSLAPDLSVEDNILLGQPCLPGGILWRSGQRAQVREVLAAVGLSELSPQAMVGGQSVATQQLIEIARALASQARIILFDEPTSSLPQADVRRLFSIIDKLKSQGLGIVYISHFLEEVREVADRYCVLRDGQQVGQGELKGVSDAQIISLMVGRDVRELYPKVPHEIGEVVVDVRHLSGRYAPRDVNLELRRGEIFGLAGLVGAGRSKLLRCLMGLERQVAGAVQLDGRNLPSSVGARRRAGIGFLSEDRKGEGLAQDLSIAENVTMGNQSRYKKYGFLKLRKREQAVLQQIQQVEVKARSAGQAVAELSGGNQQKVALGRILHQRAQVLLLDEPTKGIDVGSKAEIYRLMGLAAAQGKTVVFVSSYLPELLAVCDRIGVMARGRLIQVRSANQWTDEEIMRCAIGND
jgi:ribose transport system ATP-binding protein